LITLSELWPELRGSKRYREEFAAQHAKDAIPFQITALLKQFKLTQAELASRARVTQGVVSRAADPSYGNLTINTLVRIAAGFDVAFVPLFVSFSDLPKWFARLYEEPFTLPSFEEEDLAIKEQANESVLSTYEQPQALEGDFLGRIAAEFHAFLQATSTTTDSLGFLQKEIAQEETSARQSESSLPSFIQQGPAIPMGKLLRFRQPETPVDAALGLSGQLTTQSTPTASISESLALKER
jgi:transcriptional regulator with XRE-family HTH domain